MIAVDDGVLREAFSAAVEESMDAMFFDAAEPVAECDCEPASESITAAVLFHDSIDGEFLLSAPLQTAVALAASFMAIDAEAVERSQAEQTVCELANIICGAALSRLEPSAVLRLSPPRVIEGPCASGCGGICQHYRLLDGCISLSIRRRVAEQS